MKNSILQFLLLLMLARRADSAYKYKIKASVLSRPGSTAQEMYTHIARVMMAETMTRYQRDVCVINFNHLVFNTTDGAAVYQSLTKARDNFSKKRVAVAVGPFIDVFASTNYVILHQYHLLTSAAGQNAKLMDPEKVVSILPEPQSMARAIADVIFRLDWKNVAFLSQDDFAPVLYLGQHSIQVWPIRLPAHISANSGLEELKRNLIELRSSEKRKFILHSTRRDIVHHVMMAAKKLHLLHHTIDWFITYPDFDDIAEDQDWPGSLFGLRLLRRDRIPGNITYFLQQNMSRLDLGLAVDVVGLIQHVLIGASGGCHISPDDSDVHVTSDDFKIYLKDKSRTYSGALGEYVWGEGDNARTNYTLDVLAYRSGALDTIGLVNFAEGKALVEMDEGFTGGRSKPKDLQVFSKDVKLVVVTKQDVPFIIKRGDGYTGFSYDLLVALAQKLDFDFELVDVTEKERQKNNVHHLGALVEKERQKNNVHHLGALVEELLDGEAAMAVGALDVTAEKESLISFSYTILSTQASLLIRKGKSTQNFFQFLDPFRLDLWMMILAFIAVAGIALFLISRFDPTMRAAVEQRFDLKESAWYAINILLQGTTDYSPQTTSMRAIIAFFWFSVIIIEAAYTANLAAYLTLQQMDNRIKTVHDLARQTQVQYGVENNSSLMRFFQEQREDPFERMWAFMLINAETSLLDNTSLVIDKVLTQQYAFIADGITNDYYATQFCGIEAIDQNFGAKDYSFGFPRGAPYRDDINRALLQLKEEGKLDDLKLKWWSAGQNCTEEDDTRSVSHQTTAELGIENMVGVFIVLAAFTLLAIAVDVGQRVYRSSKEKEMEKVAVSTDGVLENQYAQYS